MSTAETIKIKVCETQEEFQQSIDLRKVVFCDEQGFSPDLEVDERDKPFPQDTVQHIIAYRSADDSNIKTVLGTVRIYKDGNDTHLGRFAVSKQARGTGIGKKLVVQAEIAARTVWQSNEMIISSQWQVEPFYKQCGYERITDEEHLDEGWRHIYLKKKL